MASVRVIVWEAGEYGVSPGGVVLIVDLRVNDAATGMREGSPVISFDPALPSPKHSTFFCFSFFLSSFLSLSGVNMTEHGDAHVVIWLQVIRHGKPYQVARFLPFIWSTRLFSLQSRCIFDAACFVTFK